MKKLLNTAAPLAFWLLVWALCAWRVGRALLLPGPLAVGKRLLELAGTGDFWLSVGATLGRVFLGLGWGALAGTALAFATHFFPWADRLISPAIRVVRATPVVSFILLVYLIYIPLSILIPSSSGLATLSVPIMAPLGQFAGIGGSLIVTAFQSASGLVNIVTPTAAVVMGGLAVGGVPYDRWVRFVWKLVLIFFLLTGVFLAVSAIL